MPTALSDRTAPDDRTALADRTALVTGSTSGIGRAIALALAERGAHVLVSGRDAERGAASVDAIARAGGSAEFVAADLSSPAGAHGLAEAAVAGGRAVDILVNNAGIFPFGATADVTDADLHAVYMTNVLVPFILVRELAPRMAGRGRGVVINTTSAAAYAFLASDAAGYIHGAVLPVDGGMSAG